MTAPTEIQPRMIIASLDAETLLHVGEALRSNLSEDILDELAAVLDPVEDLTPQAARNLAWSLHKTLRGMLHSTSPSPRLVRYTRHLLVEPCPPDAAGALGYVRRLAISVLDLADEAARFTVPPRPP